MKNINVLKNVAILLLIIVIMHNISVCSDGNF